VDNALNVQEVFKKFAPLVVQRCLEAQNRHCSYSVLDSFRFFRAFRVAVGSSLGVGVPLYILDTAYYRVQGYLAHKKALGIALLKGHRGRRFRMCEVPLYHLESRHAPDIPHDDRACGSCGYMGSKGT